MAETLEALRRVQDIQIVVELKFISVADTIFERYSLDFPQTNHQACHDGFERVGVDFNCPTGKCCAEGCGKAAIALNDKQVRALMNIAQGDNRTNILQAPKLTLFNGQQATISAVDTKYFVTSVKVATMPNGQTIAVPENKPHDLGLKSCVHATVSADHKFVQLHLQSEYTELDSSKVPLMPVTYFITPTPQGAPVPFTQFIQQPKINRLTVDSKMCIPDGGTMALVAGTWLSERREESSAPPVLSKIPYVKRMFKNVGYGREASTMLVLVTPHVMVNAESACAKCANCKDGKCCDNCPKCCEQGCKACPKCKPTTGVGEEEASLPVRPLAKAAEAVKKSPVELRAEKMAAKLVEKYHDACAQGETEKARKLARQALDLDPACFDKPQRTENKVSSLDGGDLGAILGAQWIDAIHSLRHQY